MKVKFSRLQKFVPAWNDNNELPEEEQFHVELKPMGLEDLIALMADIQSANGGEINAETLQESGGGLNIGKNIAKFQELLNSTEHLFGKYVTVHNLEDESGPVTADDVMKVPFYLELGLEILMQLAAVSTPNKAEEKN